VGRQPARERLLGPFVRRSTGEVLVVLRPPGIGYPADVRVQWATPGEGREALNELLASVLVLELDRLAAAVAGGETYRLAPLRELGDREGWTLGSQLADASSRYQLQKDDAPSAHQGPRLDLLLALELGLRVALLPFAGVEDLPTWVGRAREVHPRLVAALEGADLFEPKRAGKTAG
jgi:hypothetical protein